MKYSCLLYFLLLHIFVWSQTPEVPNVLPPSPNAASLGSYGWTPVGLFTGTPEVNIPIFDMNVGKINLPISINYSSNGIRVDEISGIVGVGWNLNAGGLITRVIMDDPDEYTSYPLPNNFPYDYTEQTLTYLQNSDNPESQYDTKSDIYSFNFNGYTGKFYLDELTKQPILIDTSPLKIERDPADSDYKFKITDPLGTVYWFGNTNSTEQNRYKFIGIGPNGYSQNNATSWYLSKIEEVQGNEINFSYDNPTVNYHSAISQNVTSLNGTNMSLPGQNLVITQSSTDLAQLSSITSRSGQINFYYSANATGFDGLDLIEIKSQEGNIIKKFLFNYDIITTSLLSLKNDHIPYFNEYGKRMFLNKVTEIDAAGVFGPSHNFKYYNADQLPPRFSYAQDYWGYYNGETNNEYLVSEDDYYLDAYVGSLYLKSFFDIEGNKKPNGNFGKNGLLKEIIYPTGGNCELFYEPHSYWGSEIVYSNDPVIIDLNVFTDEDTQQTYGEFTTETIPFTQASRVYFSTGIENCWPDINGGDPLPDPIHTTSIVSVRVAENGSSNFVFDPLNNFYNIPSGCNDPLTCPHWYHSSDINSKPNNGYAPFYIEFKQGKRYKFKVSLNWRCINGTFTTRYYDQNYEIIHKNIEVGGLRLKKSVVDDGSGNKQIKQYHYGELNDLDHSSGIIDLPRQSFIRTVENHPVYPTPYTIDMYTLLSSSTYNLYEKQGHQIGYQSVIEEFGENFSGGGISHSYGIPLILPPVPIISSMDHTRNVIPGTPFTTSFGTGYELETVNFLKLTSGFRNLLKTNNIYGENSTVEKENIVYNVRSFYHGSMEFFTTKEKIESYYISQYRTRSQWHYLDSSTTTEYDESGNPKAVTTTQYNYENPSHLQPTQVITTRMGDNKTLITKTQYPGDLTSEPYMLNLIAQNRIAEPIRVRNYQKKSSGTEELLSTQRTEYGSYGNRYLPMLVQTAKGANALENRLLYHSYDGYGNLREVSQPNGARTVYVMGYDFTLPVAKLENVAISDIPQSYLDDIYYESKYGTESTLFPKLDALRGFITGLNKPTLVTTLTYIPLVGVHTVTDPKGYRMTYEYDDFGRLKYVKDMDNKILSENQYHYIND